MERNDARKLSPAVQLERRRQVSEKKLAKGDKRQSNAEQSAPSHTNQKVRWKSMLKTEALRRSASCVLSEIKKRESPFTLQCCAGIPALYRNCTESEEQAQIYRKSDVFLFRVYRCIILYLLTLHTLRFGGPAGIRTPNQGIMSRASTLYVYDIKRYASIVKRSPK